MSETEDMGRKPGGEPASAAARPSTLGSLRAVLAFKAYEIEELADRWFFRPCGAVVAYAASRTPLTPNQLTVVGALLGVAGGGLLYRREWALWGFATLIVHSIVDSADGQLARIVGKSSLEGRVLDGVGGYLTHIAMYFGISCGHYAVHGEAWIFGAALAAGLCNVAHAGLYDFYRNEYIGYAVKGRAPADETFDTGTTVGRLFDKMNRDYQRNQRLFAPYHVPVVEALRRRFGPGGALPDPVRESYRRLNYWRVRGWNFLGDNTRFYAVGAAAWLGRLELWFAFNLVVMNAALLLLSWSQARADRTFLAELER